MSNVRPMIAARIERVRAATLSPAGTVALLCLLGAQALPAMADPSDFDGKWVLEDRCTSAAGLPATNPFGIRLIANVENGKFSGIYKGVVLGEIVEDRFSGAVDGSGVTIFMDGQSISGEKWHEILGGHASTSSEMIFDGTHSVWASDSWTLAYTCFGTLREVEPASTTLSLLVPVSPFLTKPPSEGIADRVSAAPPAAPAPVRSDRPAPAPAFDPAPNSASSPTSGTAPIGAATASPEPVFVPAPEFVQSSQPVVDSPAPAAGTNVEPQPSGPAPDRFAAPATVSVNAGPAPAAVATVPVVPVEVVAENRPQVAPATLPPPSTIPQSKDVIALSAVPENVPAASRSTEAASPTPSKASFDGSYSGLLPSCQTPGRRYESIVVANDHFDAIIANTRFAVDIPADGGFSATAARPGRGRARISGKIGVGTMEIDYESPLCRSHERLTAQTFPSASFPTVPAPAAPVLAAPVLAAPVLAAPVPAATAPATAVARPDQVALNSPAVETASPMPERGPEMSPAAVLDGTYSGPVVLSGMPSCVKTIPEKLPAIVKDHEFHATIFNVQFSVDVPSDGAFSASGVRRTDRARTEVNGKVSGNTIELEMHNQYCSAQANLAAVNDAEAAATPPASMEPALRVAAGAHRYRRRVGER